MAMINHNNLATLWLLDMGKAFACFQKKLHAIMHVMTAAAVMKPFAFHVIMTSYHAYVQL